VVMEIIPKDVDKVDSVISRCPVCMPRKQNCKRNDKLLQ
jgi:hypothetical protein